MHLEYTPEQRALRKELREYFAAIMTPETRHAVLTAGESPEPFRTIVRKLGSDGWLGVGWPKEVGGQGLGAVEQFIMFDEVQRAGVPYPFVTVNTVGPTIMKYGNDEQKDRFLKGILAGEINFAIGYSEPSAGTDLASLRTTAVLDGAEWVVNGNKIFTSGAEKSDYVWLAVRTEPDVAKHKGISILLVPTSSEGFKWTPITTVGGVTTSATYYDNVRVPSANLMVERGAGWQLITNQLNHERVALAALGGNCWRLWGEVREWAANTDAPEGGKLIDRAWVRADLARCYVKLEAMKLINWKLTGDILKDRLGPADSSAVKFYGTETHVEVYRALLGILGGAGWLRYGSRGALLHGEVERMGRAAQINTFGGGVNEVQREIVAAAGLGMARRAR